MYVGYIHIHDSSFFQFFSRLYDNIDQFVIVYGLKKILEYASFQRPLCILEVVITRKHNYDSVIIAFVKRLHKLKTVHYGHFDITYDNVGMVKLDFLQSDFAVLRGIHDLDIVFIPVDGFGYARPYKIFVVNHYHFVHNRSPFCNRSPAPSRYARKGTILIIRAPKRGGASV